MPRRKKRRLLSRNHALNMRMKRQRAAETDEQRRARRETQRIRTAQARAQARASETPEQRQSRLEADRERSARDRANAKARQARLEADRIRAALAQASKAREEQRRAAKLEAQRVYRARCRLRKEKESRTESNECILFGRYSFQSGPSFRSDNEISVPRMHSLPVAGEPIQSSLDPEVVVKEEPIDIYENPTPSTSRMDDEFILPGLVPSASRSGHESAVATDSLHSGTTPTVEEVFSTAIKQEPVEDEAQTTSNDKSFRLCHEFISIPTVGEIFALGIEQVPVVKDTQPTSNATESSSSNAMQPSSSNASQPTSSNATQ